MKQKTLSKSKLMLGFQCPKNLWLTLNQQDLATKVSVATQMQFDEGNEVGELAREHAGKGLLIETENYWDYQKAHDRTEKAIKDGEKVIFEASFLGESVFARADILRKDKKGWHLIEVKKSTSVKDYHYQDAGIQSSLIESTGLKLSSVSIMHINNQSVFPDLSELFLTQEITGEVLSQKKEVEKKIAQALKVAASKSEPKIDIGPHCSDPFECAFKEHCWKKVPKHSVFDLPGVNAKKAWELFDSGQVAIKDLDADEFKGQAKRAIEVTQSKKMFVDSSIIKAELSSWEWPLYYFDFETIGPAVPRYKGTKPYGQVPFQFSCHTQAKRPRPGSAPLGHFEYLHQEATDPRPGIIKAILAGLGTKGSIVAYNKSFEIGVINKLAEFDKKNSKALLALIDRFVDPLPIFRSAVYHPDFLGSFSIKSVAPALLGDKLSYDHLEVGDGSTAQAWAEKILPGKIDKKDKEKVVADLLEYCRQDTLAMVELVRWLMSQSGGQVGRN